MCEMMNDGDSWSSKRSGGVQRLLVPKSGWGEGVNMNDTAVTKIPHVHFVKAGELYKKRNCFSNRSRNSF